MENKYALIIKLPSDASGHMKWYETGLYCNTPEEIAHQVCMRKTQPEKYGCAIRGLNRPMSECYTDWENYLLINGVHRGPDGKWSEHYNMKIHPDELESWVREIDVETWSWILITSLKTGKIIKSYINGTL